MDGEIGRVLSLLISWERRQIGSLLRQSAHPRDYQPQGLGRVGER